MKQTRLITLVLSIILTLPPLTADAQVGPGGVGNITNTQLWLRSDSLITIQPLNYVTSWYDLSGHMHDFGPVVMGQSVPSLTLDVLNGYPAVTFSDQGGVGGDFLGYNGSLGIAGSDAATVVIVARNTTTTDEKNGGLYMGQKNVGGVNAVRSYNLEYADAVRFNGHDQVFDDGHTLNDWKIIYYTNPAGASVNSYGAYLNGTPLTPGSSSSYVPSLVANYALLGATQMNATYNPQGYFNGDMLEVAVFSGQLNDAERIVLHNNLGAKYMLPIADDHYDWEITHSRDVSGIAAYNGTIFTNAWSTPMLSISSPTDLSDNEYLFFGHDNGDATTWTNNEVPAPGTFRLAREWRIDETSDVGTVTVSIPAISLPAFPAGYTILGILTDDDGDFTSGTTMHQPVLAAGTYTLDLNLDDGQYLTIIAFRSEINYTVESASGLENITNVTVQAYLNYPHTSDVSVDYAVTGGTASVGTDFLLPPGNIFIPAGSVTGSFDITVIDDDLVEPPETIITGLSNPSAGLSVGTQNSYTYTILNDDNVYASFSSATASGAEGNSPNAVTSPEIVISGGIISTSGSLILVVTNGTATSEDWSQTSSLVTIPAGDYTTPVSIPIPAPVLTILGDLMVEDDETVNLSMNTFVTVVAGPVINSVYTIINDDSSLLSVTATTPAIAEGGPGAPGTGTFRFSLTNPVSTARTVSYTVSGSAISGTDFTALPGSFVMPAGSVTYDLDLTSVADLVVEGDETVVITITGVSGSPAVSVDATPATITISDDDLPEILYSPVSLTMSEGASASIEVWLSAPPAVSVTVDISTTLTGIISTSPASLIFTTADYATHKLITVQSVDNDVMGDQSDNVIISVNDALSDDPFDPLPDISIPVTITNNDIASIVTTPATVTVAENSNATFTVQLAAAPPSGNVVVDLTSNDTDVATIDIPQLTFTSVNWNVPRTITVTGIDNNTIPDASTTISLAVNDALSYDGYDGVTATVTINVTNDDIAGFIVSPLALTIDEGGPAGQFSVVLTAQPLTDVVFDLVNADPVYVTNVAQITFTSLNWDVPVPVSVTAIEDALDADRTDIIAVTVNQALTDPDFDGMVAQDVTITIEDNDPPVITGCPADITVSNDPGACSAVVSWTPPVSTAPMVSTHLPGSSFPVGTTTVTYTSTDDDGMISICEFDITVNDTELPVLNCTSAIVNLDASGNASIVAGDVLSGVPTDNCSIASVTLSISSFTCADLGDVTVTVTATDASGNVATCDAVVTVTDPFPASVDAGPDDEICDSQTSYSITGALSENMSLMWTTSGDGTFSDPSVIDPVYTRGATDITEVTLTLTGNKLDGCPETLADVMTLTFTSLPLADAGADMDLCEGTADVTLADASAANGTVAWTTSGDGTFSDPAAVNPVYTFGPSDTAPVILTMTVTSTGCGSIADDLSITFTTAPVADAGPDGAVCASESGYQVTGASHGGGTVNWITSGDGSFDDAAADNPYYYFGTADQSDGTVTLTMEVIGGGSCGTVSDPAIITINPMPVIQVTGHDNITCNGLTDGEIHLDAATGTTPYSYSIDGAPFQASGDFTGLSAASYYIEVMDANGCVSDTTLEIIEPLPFTATLDSIFVIECNGADDGAIYTTASGGTAPYNISWTGPDGYTASTEDVTGLASGTYAVTITDFNGCATFNFIEDITQPDAIEITGETVSDYGGYGVSCPASDDGFISLSVSGGTPPLALLWSGPQGFSSTLDALSMLIEGTYALTVTDASGCILTKDYIITAPEAISITAETEPASCPDTKDGMIHLTVSGGSGTLYYMWNDGITSADRAGLAGGEYTVQVTDGNGCTRVETVTVDIAGENCLRVYEIITPNGDGSNDTWKLRNAELYPDAEIFVYSRWGKLVYHSRNASDEWDGTYNGQVLPNDSYHYVIHLNDGSEPLTGVISIISK